jgi:hypothetical protein
MLSPEETATRAEEAQQQRGAVSAAYERSFADTVAIEVRDSVIASLGFLALGEIGGDDARAVGRLQDIERKLRTKLAAAIATIAGHGDETDGADRRITAIFNAEFDTAIATMAGHVLQRIRSEGRRQRANAGLAIEHRR